MFWNVYPFHFPSYLIKLPFILFRQMWGIEWTELIWTGLSSTSDMPFKMCLYVKNYELQPLYVCRRWFQKCILINWNSRTMKKRPFVFHKDVEHSIPHLNITFSLSSTINFPSLLECPFFLCMVVFWMHQRVVCMLSDSQSAGEPSDLLGHHISWAVTAAAPVRSGYFWFAVNDIKSASETAGTSGTILPCAVATARTQGHA